MNEHARMSVDGVATQTAAAVHRRDHQHDGGDCCHPHAVEVVNLGDQAVVVCHDCRADTGFLSTKSAARLAADHRSATLTATVVLPHTAA